ncbi:MAG: nuclear transport factor 2 family protein, partial [Lysobacteraceae bacterium]
ARGLIVAPGFIHHNPWFAGDRASLLQAMEASAAAAPNKSFEVQQVIDGDGRVAVHSHLVRADGGGEYAVVHIVRVEAGRIVELWDVAQQLPPDSPNAHGAF